MRRRLRRDLLLAVCYAALLGFVTFVAAATPALIRTTLDEGAQEAVADAGYDADLLVSVPTGLSDGVTRTVEPVVVDQVADGIVPRLPPALQASQDGATATVLTPTIDVAVDGATSPDNAIDIQVGMATGTRLDDIVLTEGRLPSNPESATGPVEVMIGSEAASAAGIEVGSVLEVPAGEQLKGGPTSFVVTGLADLVDEAQASTRQWIDLPTLWTPVERLRSGRIVGLGVTVLTDPEGERRAEQLIDDSVDAVVRVGFDPESFSEARLYEVLDEIEALTVNSSSLAGDSTAQISARSSLANAVSGYPAAAAGALAQLTTAAEGVGGVGAVTLFLTARLLVLRRERDVAWERARGASLLSVALTSFVESLLLAAVGVAAGAALLLALGASSDLMSLAVVLLVGVAAPVLQTVIGASAVWRAPRGKVAQAGRDARRRARRLVAEALVVVVTVAAGAALFSRGFGRSAGGTPDLLIGALPLLVALTASLLILRLQLPAVRFLAALARRSKGAAGIVAASQAEASRPALPLMALTVAFALAIGGATLVQTIDAGEVDASWQRVGADARVDGSITDDEIASARAADGVTAAGAAASLPGTPLEGGSGTTIATVLAIDPGYCDVLSRLPRSAHGTAADLCGKLASGGSDDAVPVMADEVLAERLTAETLELSVEDQVVPIRIVGTTSAGPNGYDKGPFLFVDRTALAEASGVNLTVDTLLLMGDGADAAGEATAGSSGSTLTSRTAWLADQRTSALPSGVVGGFVTSVGALLVLGMIALATATIAGGQARSRTLSLLRTLGLPRRTGWLLVAVETVPLLVASLLGGIAASIVAVLLIAPRLGLGALTGGTGDPPIASTLPATIAAIGAAVIVLLVTTVAERIAYRRERLSETLRVGDPR
ncbi:hypothetical protein DDQ50_07705 [Amnibacterium flavum]|uniref:ABC3 transporter permease C-terminal domain-containing protein n=2 Tax=Amnibacterium flavum TaxID=2173173 RepID=A0A2V1HM38_9MICO|nr:hypothetical protein DDQ50_07705 [Amnibacterium flavum]